MPTCCIVTTADVFLDHKNGFDVSMLNVKVYDKTIRKRLNKYSKVSSEETKRFLEQFPIKSEERPKW